MPQQTDAQTIAVVRLLILATIAAALIVTEAELLFVGHTNVNNGQIIAVILIGVGLSTTTLHVILRNTASIVIFRFAMYLFLVFGVDGLLTHYNFAFQAALKSQPELRGLSLFYAVITGHIPLLAPGMMIQIGLLGLLYTFNHPLDVRLAKHVHYIHLRD